jgi:hypothetical protein
MLWRREEPCTAGNQTRAVQPIVRHPLSNPLCFITVKDYLFQSPCCSLQVQRVKSIVHYEQGVYSGVSNPRIILFKWQTLTPTPHTFLTMEDCKSH